MSLYNQIIEKCSTLMTVCIFYTMKILHSVNIKKIALYGMAKKF